MSNKEYQSFVPENDSELAGWGINVDDKKIPMVLCWGFCLPRSLKSRTMPMHYSTFFVRCSKIRI
jgi:hypothetical protein